MPTVIQHYEKALAEAYNFQEFMAVLKSYSQECRRVTEFGVHKGNSTWALLAAQPDQLTSYDVAVAKNDEGHGAFESLLKAVASAVEGTSTEFRFILGDSGVVEIEETDLLFIDSLHTYAHLSRELILHHLRVRKFIILHDTTTFGSIDEDLITGTPGLWPAVQEFLYFHRDEWRLKERLEIYDGLTILERHPC